MFDVISFILGRKKGIGHVELSGGTDYTFADDNNDGNIEIEETGGN